MPLTYSPARQSVVLRPSHSEPLQETDIEQLARSADPQVKRLALELLHARWGLRTVRKLLGVYDPERVERAWRMTFDLTGDER